MVEGIECACGIAVDPRGIGLAIEFIPITQLGQALELVDVVLKPIDLGLQPWEIVVATPAKARAWLTQFQARRRSAARRRTTGPG